MAGRRPRKRKTGGKSDKASARKRSAKPVLGNDPFERGAAMRRSAPVPVAPIPAATETSAPPVSLPLPSRPAEEEGEAVRVSTASSDSSSRLHALESRVESAAATAASRLRDLARQEASGQHAKDLLQTVAGLLPVLRERLGALASLRSFFAGTGELDAFGMDRGLFERAMPVLEFLYTSWWRVELRQIENVSAQGPVMLVANHGSALAWDALVLRLALLRDHPAHRELRPLLDEYALKLPLAGVGALRLGAVPATPENALFLLREGRALAVFPEGSHNARRPWTQRYRVERFGRGGFAKLALRTGAPIVPCAIVGSEETSAPFVRTGWLADTLGMPFLASAPPLPGLLGVIPLPSRWSVRFGEPIDTQAAGPGAADDSARVLEVTERARASLQQMLDEDVAARRSVYL
jgi:1-acyl-sn-glycerol-3-phosphate acyltransferase